jgi:hypothetical protein
MPAIMYIALTMVGLKYKLRKVELLKYGIAKKRE